MNWRSLIGKRFTYKYQLKTLLGSGGSGAVFAADEIINDCITRQVAVKLIPVEFHRKNQQFAELEISTQLRHPALVTCFSPEAASLDGQDYWGLVMELGEWSLRERLKHGCLSEAEGLTIVQQVIAGLKYLHQHQPRPLVHRDLKPENILQVNGTWKLADFGIVRLLDSSKSAVYTEQIGGTLLYMPPEGFNGEIRPAWDYWALGILLIEVMTGEHPFAGCLTPAQVIAKVTQGEVVIPKSIPGWLQEIIAGCVGKDPRQRWGAAEIEARLSRLRGSFQPTIRVIPQPPETPAQKAKGLLTRIFGPNSPVEVPAVPKEPVQEFFPDTSKPPELAKIYHEVLGKGVALEMVLLPAGRFRMGSTDADPWAKDSEKLQHQVTFAHPFYLGKYPITQAQYRAVMGTNPSHFQDNDQNPVENVSWQDAQEFCQKLRGISAKPYRLPSEAEWEYACRAGTTSRYYFGDNANLLEDYAWFTENSGNKTHPVGEKRPNAWGLHDLHGNVWEWCEDLWHDNYIGAPSDGRARESNNTNQKRLLRGGSWLFSSKNCRSAYRLRFNADNRGRDFGFRVALSFLPGSL